MPKGKKHFFQNDEDYLDYLNETLIPDLEEGGHTNLVDDFKQLAGMINFGYYDADSKDFARFLKGTLIPDLRESGRGYMADDFANGLVLWNQNKRKRRIYRKSQHERRG